jgi:triosephosphate isomerase
MERTPIVAGNWKMHHGAAAASAFCEGILNEELPQDVQAVICPPFTSLPAAAMLLAGSSIGLGAQNVHWEGSGAFTGEIAAPMLAELGVEWVIVGHSERRAMFCETDETAHRRAARAQEEDLTVIFCVGETLEQREARETFAVLERQCGALEGLEPARLVVAYEPVWAIGTGRTASPEQAQEAHAFIRGRLERLFPGAAQDVRILYGGSVKPANAASLFAQPDVDGGLVGGASLDVASFSAIIRAAAMPAA